MTEQERLVIVALQDGMPLVAEPYRELAARAGMDERAFRVAIERMLAEGKIKRLGAIPNHYAIGVTANGMSVWDIPDVEVSAMGRRLGAYPEVTHCYCRPRYRPEWPYNLYGMVHADTREKVVRVVDRIARELGVPTDRYAILFSRRLLKKQGLRLDRNAAEVPVA